MASAFTIDATTGDMVRSAGRLTRAVDVEHRRQAARSNLRFIQGEWFLDVQGVGVPFRTLIFGVKNPNISAIRAAFTKAVLDVPGIVSVDSMDLSLDSATRVLSGTFSATDTTGAAIVADAFEVPLP